jgi:spore coat protein CotH
MKKILILLALIPFLSFSQNAGDNVFGTNQIIRVDINFTQTGFWDSLVANYTSETDMMAASISFTDLQGTSDLDSIKIRLKGNSSYGHPGNKKSFKIDMNDYVSGQSYDGLKKLNFNNGFKDPTFLREKVFMDYCKDLGILAPRVNFANVYMNGTFWGFYTIVEQIDDQFLDWAIMDDTGNLFKAGNNTTGSLGADLVYYGAASNNYSGRYELKTNEVLNDWSDLVSLISFINTSLDTDFGNNLAANVNKDLLIKSFVSDNLFSNLDSYLNSARNYYIYHNQTTGLWEWIKWDGNESFGMYSGGPGLGNLEQLAPNYVAANRPLLSKIFANTALYNEYKAEMCVQLQNTFKPANINTKIDALKDLIQNDVTNDVNKMYTTQNFIDNIESNVSISGGGPMENQTMLGLKSFISNRSTYLASSISCVLGDDKISQDQSTIAFPNPFQSSFTINSSMKDIKIVDLSGKEITFETKIIGNTTKINLSTKQKGIYFLSGKIEGESINVKLIQE